MTKRICVTGASGRAGRVTVAELLAQQPNGDNHVSEWNTFREKLFSRWNL